MKEADNGTEAGLSPTYFVFFAPAFFHLSRPCPVFSAPFSATAKVTSGGVIFAPTPTMDNARQNAKINSTAGRASMLPRNHPFRGLKLLLATCIFAASASAAAADLE